MTRSELFGTACKTCRRLGRKCDRTLPACVRCNNRGVVCEGYVFPWVGTATPVGTGSTNNSKGRTIAHSRTEQRLNKLRKTKIDDDQISLTLTSAKTTAAVPDSNSGLLRLFGAVQDDGTASRVETTSQEKNRHIFIDLSSSAFRLPPDLGPPNDNIGPLITYCQASPICYALRRKQANITWRYQQA